MTITEAVIIRINGLLKERNMTKQQLINKSGVPIGTLSSLYKKLAKSVNLSTLFALARGFEMSATEFLSHEIFNDIQVD